jgi:GntR family transcriptional regulator, transcriptional repressor for pyruvate dehydrogenase complex
VTQSTEPSSRPGRLYQWVVDRVLEDVAVRGLKPGDALPTERELAAELRVSRNVLREGFRVLEEWGLIRTRQGSGRYLRQLPENLGMQQEPAARLEVASIADVLESRLILEEQIAVLACHRRTLSEIREITRLSNRLTTWQDNVDFHVAVASATHNFMLVRLVREQMQLLEDLRQRDFYSSPEATQTLLKEHRILAEAIAARDADRARETIRTHLLHTLETVGARGADSE